MRSSQWRVRIKASQVNGRHYAVARYNASNIASSFDHATRAEAVAAVRVKLAELHNATAKYACKARARAILTCPKCGKEAYTQHGSDMYCDSGHVFSVHDAVRIGDVN